MNIGDYVLATKYCDGDPQDHWCVGFYAGFKNERHIVVDSNGDSFRYSGFRRAAKISARVGSELLAHVKFIERSGFSVWHWRRNIKTLQCIS